MVNQRIDCNRIIDTINDDELAEDIADDCYARLGANCGEAIEQYRTMLLNIINEGDRTMIDTMVERVARQWVTSTMDPDVKYAAERDWDGFLEFFTAIFDMLMPLFEKCLLTSEKTKARSAAWLTAIDGGRKARRELKFGERIRLAIFRRQFSRELGPEVSDEIDDVELMRVFLKVTAESTPDEITQFRADVDRLRSEAA